MRDGRIRATGLLVPKNMPDTDSPNELDILRSYEDELQKGLRSSGSVIQGFHHLSEFGSITFETRGCYLTNCRYSHHFTNFGL